jgi:CelD/BcsL family acetyltransferase involved in cellulose biosynthesis
MRTTLRAVDGAQFKALAGIWQEVEARAATPHYALTHQWLSAWVEAHGPRHLVHVEIAAGARGLAVGLLECLPLGRVRFAGAPVSPRGCLLIADGQEIAAWSAFAGALARELPRRLLLQCFGASAAAGGLPHAVATPTPEYALALPGTFDAYLGGLSPAARKSMRQKLRRVARGAVAEAEAAEHPAAIGRFLALHHLRAGQRGEHHPQMNARLRRLLLALPEHGTGVRLRVFELTVSGAVVGSTIRLDHEDTAFFYNGGFDPAHAGLSPGISLELASIRDAIELGMTRFDLGPGRYRYKTDLGGVPTDRYRVTSGGRGVSATMVALTRSAHDHGRAAILRSRARFNR